jgi:uncharacterized damage-inducible protein DinB
MNEPLAEMFRYNRWATAALVDACAGLSDDYLDAAVPGISGTVRELLMHVAGGQRTDALRTQGRQHEGELTRHAPWPGFEELRRLADESSDELLAIAAALDADRDVDLPWEGKRYRHKVSFFLAAALVHGVEHRTEIKFALAQVGVETPGLDGWDYAAAMGYGEDRSPVSGSSGPG